MRRWVGTALLVPGLLLADLWWSNNGPLWQSPSPTASQAAELLESICPGYIAGDPPSGCRPCPMGTSVGDAWPENENKQELFHLDTVFYGSFTTPGTEEAVASFSGCESHATSFGGSVLLTRKVRGTWVGVQYLQATTTEACRIYHLRTGRDLLLCEHEDMHMGYGSQWISVWSVSKDQAPTTRDVITLMTDTGANTCHPAWGSIDKANLHDLNGDGMPGLTLWFSLSRGTRGESCTGDTSDVTVEKLKLDFLFQQDTESFVPTPSSKALIASHHSFFNSDN